METGWIETSKILIAIIGAIIGAGASIWGAIQKMRAGKAEEGLAEARAALDAIIAGLELMPASDPKVKTAKQIIRGIGDITGAQAKTIQKAVDDVKAILKGAGFIPSRDETESRQVERAAKAIMAARQIRAAAKCMAVFVVLGLLVSACCPAQSARLTSETLVSAMSPGEPDELVVEWPAGINADDIVTVDVISGDGVRRADSVAPLPPLAASRAAE